MKDKECIINGLQIRIAFLADRASQEDMCFRGFETCEWYIENFCDQWDLLEPLVVDKTSQEYKLLANFDRLLVAFYRKAASMSIKGVNKQRQLLKDGAWRNIQRLAADLQKRNLNRILN